MRVVAALLLLIIGRAAYAKCVAPPYPCVCDYKSRSVVVANTNGDGRLVVVEQFGEPVAIGDGGSLEVVPIGEGTHLVSFAAGDVTGTAFEVEEGTFNCVDTGQFRASRSRVIDAMLSENCFAAMADAGVPVRAPQPCNDVRYGPLCGSGDALPALFALIALAVVAYRRRRTVG